MRTFVIWHVNVFTPSLDLLREDVSTIRTAFWTLAAMRVVPFIPWTFLLDVPVTLPLAYVVWVV